MNTTGWNGSIWPESATSLPAEAISIKVGNHVDNDPKKSEALFDGFVELGYYLNDDYLGEGNKGATALLSYLLEIPNGTDVTIVNPVTDYIGGPSSRPGARDQEYKYPFVMEWDLSRRINTELDRIRGWSDSTEPKLPYRIAPE